MTNDKQLIKKVDNEFKPNPDSVYEIIEKKIIKKEENIILTDENDSKIVSNSKE